MNDGGMGILMALGMEAFVSIHMSLFVLLPLAKMIAKENSRKVFWLLFGIRVAYLLVYDFFVTPAIAILDFLSVFVGAAIVGLLTFRQNRKGTINSQTVKSQTISGTPAGTMTAASAESAAAPEAEPKKAVHPNDFDPLFSLSEEECVEQFIRNEMQRAGLEDGADQIPEEMLRRKIVFHVIFALLLFVYLSMFFFHFSASVYLAGFVVLVIYGFLTGRYTLMKYLKKEIQSRPQEKISNIVMNVKASLVTDYSRKVRWGLVIIAVSGVLLLFSRPIILYEKAEGDYYVRFYACGITNMTSVTIPDTHKGERVVGLRGNTFSNMPFLKEVSLPDTMVEIRGQAFKNCKRLEHIDLPRNLEYLGGGAFYNCKKLKSIELPDSITYLGGEAFYGCTSLREAELSEKLTEIRGNTFEECSSLLRIEIPDGVVRIGGHAFYGNTSLEEVLISPDSQLQEIGSSAFRCCDSLYEIVLPRSVSVNERAFKETPVRIEYYE